MRRNVIVMAVSVVAAVLAGAALQAPSSRDEAVISRAADGHFWAIGRINGRPLRMLVDTGATAVALSREDAARLGIQVSASSFSEELVTAGGVRPAARIQLDSLNVAGAALTDVEALVVDGPLPAPLLGMSYLGRLSRMEASPQRLLLEP